MMRGASAGGCGKRYCKDHGNKKTRTETYSNNDQTNTFGGSSHTKTIVYECCAACTSTMQKDYAADKECNYTVTAVACLITIVIILIIVFTTVA